MNDRALEWVRQSDYDLDTAKYMHKGGRYAYAVFMCHLAAEKALKGLFEHRRGETPPRTHNLIYLLGQLDIRPEKPLMNLITVLGEANIATRYPESLKTLQENYTEEITSNMIRQCEEVVQWIKSQF